MITFPDELAGGGGGEGYRGGINQASGMKHHTRLGRVGMYSPTAADRDTYIYLSLDSDRSGHLSQLGRIFIRALVSTDSVLLLFLFPLLEE